ncbi:hypothetical protein POTOM_015755 [Populus tomentosa]|uniref:Transmembrane protein n=1 Tax=Populus tomentosa TaxID=118781 RepID=A0A8X8D691_POPTO|nr:hypothetical protein POTOM_015755 [Populus tomentosa]
MGFNQTFKFFCAFLLFLLISIVAFSSASSCHIVIQPSSPAKELTQYQVFYIKNTNPFILDKEPSKNRKEKRKMLMMKRRKEMIKNFKTRSLSAMLPKGSVPPSGSSPCHNQKPNSKVTLSLKLSSIAALFIERDLSVRIHEMFVTSTLKFGLLFPLVLIGPLLHGLLA